MRVYFPSDQQQSTDRFTHYSASNEFELMTIMRMLHLCVFFFAVIWLTVSAITGAATAQSETESTQVQSDVKSCVAAVYKSDVRTALGCTLPRIVELMGGEQATEVQLNAAFANLQKARLKLESMSFPKPPQFFNGVTNRYVFVPTLSVVVANGQKAESLNFQLGMFDRETKSWKYVEGSRVNAANAATIFDDFPKDIEFPPTYRKKL